MSESHDQRADQRAGAPTIELGELSSPEQCAELARVLARIWGLPDVSSVIAPDALWAMAHSGCYVAGVRLVGNGGHRDALIGGGFGWPTRADNEWRLHSHVVGFLEGYRGMGLGARVKHHQRDWAETSGLQAIEWTYDPLVAANARFNLAKLGARVMSFHHDFYGVVDDDFSAGLGSDRLLVRWGVDDVSPGEIADAGAQPILSAGGDGEPVVHDTGAARVSAQIPADIIRIRRDDRDRARRWAGAFAATVGEAMLAGGRVVGFTQERTYLIDR